MKFYIPIVLILIVGCAPKTPPTLDPVTPLKNASAAVGGISKSLHADAKATLAATNAIRNIVAGTAVVAQVTPHLTAIDQAANNTESRANELDTSVKPNIDSGAKIAEQQGKLLDRANEVIGSLQKQLDSQARRIILTVFFLSLFGIAGGIAGVIWTPAKKTGVIVASASGILAAVSLTLQQYYEYFLIAGLVVIAGALGFAIWYLFKHRNEIFTLNKQLVQSVIVAEALKQDLQEVAPAKVDDLLGHGAVPGRIQTDKAHAAKIKQLKASGQVPTAKPKANSGAGTFRSPISID